MTPMGLLVVVFTTEKKTDLKEGLDEVKQSD